jgi:hypothetical protein
MTQKQTVRIPVDKHTNAISELYVLRSYNNIRGIESTNGAVCEDRINGIKTKPPMWVIRGFSLMVKSVIKTVSWLNQLGRYEIDIQRLESNQNQYLGLRIRGLDR